MDRIPAHWNTQKLKHVSTVEFSNVDKHKKAGEVPVRLCNYVDVYYNDYITPDLDFMEATASPDEIRHYRLRESDVIVTKDSETWDDIAVPAYVPADLDGVLCGYHLAMIRPALDVVDGEYLFRAFSACRINDQFRVAATGITRYGLGKHWLEDSVFLVPPLPEQRAIAAFLDRETAKIDTLIRRQERLIELLEEKRAALISHAVTKGLDPDVSTKDSGIPWIGRIPEHWNIIQVRHVAQSLQTGPFGSQLHSSEYISNGIPVVNPAHMEDGHIKPDWEVTVDDGTLERLKHHKLQVGDIVFARRGDLGRCALVTAKEAGWLCGTGGLRMRPVGDWVHPPFLNRMLSTRGIAEWLALRSVGSTMDNINTSILSRLPLPIPPLPEQRAIAAFLDRETSNLDKLVGKVRKMIEGLQEYRTALVSAAVTGKIDVRGVADHKGHQGREACH
jgi:type I restriction enzyme S subunit